MKKQNILIFIDWFLPGTRSGGPVRSYANLIAHLGNDFNFYVITRDTDYCSEQVYQNIISDSWNTLNANTQVYYISKEKLDKRNLKNIIAEIDFDIAYINGIYSWFFSILPLILLKKYNNRKIVAARGMLNPQAFSVKKYKKLAFLVFAKIFKLYKSVEFHATNEVEAEYIRKRISIKNKVLVAPNLPRKLKPNYFIKRDKKQNELKLITTARISKEKGTLKTIRALSDIFNYDIVLDLYGTIYDKPYWEICKESILKLPPNIKVNYKGSIEGDAVIDTLSNYHFFIMPSEGENFGHSILEALLSGCPVLISDMTPWRSLEAKKIGWDISLSQPEKFTAAIEAAAQMDQETYTEWSQAAHNFAKEFCNNEAVLKANKELFK